MIRAFEAFQVRPSRPADMAQGFVRGMQSGCLAMTVASLSVRTDSASVVHMSDNRTTKVEKLHYEHKSSVPGRGKTSDPKLRPLDVLRSRIAFVPISCERRLQNNCV